MLLNNVRFQKISKPTPRMVNGNSEGGGGGGNSQIFKETYEAKLEISGEWEGPNQKAIF